jgi:hypothetical protein
MSMPRVRFDHLVRHVIDLTDAVPLSGEALLVPGGDATEGAVRVAPAARHQGCDAVVEALCGLTAAIRARQGGQIGQGRVLGDDGAALGIAHAQAGQLGEGRTFLDGLAELDHRFLGLLADDRVDFREIREDLERRERAEMASHRDVAAIAAIPKRDGEREEVAGTPLERQRDSDDQRRRLGADDRLQRRTEVGLLVERNQLGPVAGHGQRRRDVAQAQVLFDLGPDECNPVHEARVRRRSAVPPKKAALGKPLSKSLHNASYANFKGAKLAAGSS